MKRLFSAMYGESVFYYGLLWAIVFLVPVVSYLVWLRTYPTLKVMLTLPGIPVRSPLGNLDGFLKSLLTEGKAGFRKHCFFIFEKYAKDVKVLAFWFAWRPTVGIFDTDVLETVLTSQDALEKDFFYSFLHPWLGTGLLTSGGNKWKSRRRLLTPTFHFRILETFLHVFNEQSLVLVQQLREHTDRGVVDVFPYLKRCTLDIICETAMGVKIGAQTDKCPEYVQALNEVGKQFLNRTLRPWLWSPILYPLFPSGREYRANLNILHSFTRQVIQEKKKLLLEKNDNRNSVGNLLEQCEQKGNETEHDDNVYIGRKKMKSFLDLLLHYHLQEGAISEEGIREEVDTFMFEGHDTTATGIGWALYNVGLYPDVQKRIHEELDSVYGEDTEREVSAEDLKEMKYLECVIKESLRLYPPVPIIARILSKDVPIPKLGLTLPKGMPAIFPLPFIHRREDIFPDPERFDPDRFLPENVTQIHPFGYIPFSAGPRNCIGQKFALMEEKVIVANVLRHYTVWSVDSPDDLVLLPELVIRSTNGIRLELRKRALKD